MNQPPRISYRVGATDHIEHVNAAWIAFAQANCGTHLLPPQILNRSLWDMISDPTSRQLYALMLERVRKGKGSVRFRFRCDAPGQRRLFEMSIGTAGSHGRHAVEFESVCLAQQERPEVALLDSTVKRTDEFVRVCAWCMRLPVPSGEWLEVEQAIPALGVFEIDGRLPSLTHGICPDCFETFTASLEDPSADEEQDIPSVGALPPDPTGSSSGP